MEKYRQGMTRVDRLIDQGASFSGHEPNCAFLNTGGGNFAPVAGLSGFDHADDTRAVLTTDWDGDGAVDIITINRTGPQLRFLRNVQPNLGDWISLQLPVGAVATLILPDGGLLRQSVKGGEGFLSQSSSRLHFGLGKGSDFSKTKLTVNWPDGTAEPFQLPTANTHYQLVKGSGQSKKYAQPAAIKLTEPAPMADAGVQMTGQAVFPTPWPFPPIPLADGACLGPKDKPLLVRLYDTSCADCVADSSQWTSDTTAAVDQAILWLGKPPIKVPSHWQSAAATDITLAFLTEWQKKAFSIDRPLPNVHSWLISAQGELLAVFRGQVPDQSLRGGKLALLFPGQWLAPPELPDPLTWLTFLVPRGAFRSAGTYFHQHKALMSKHPAYAAMTAALAEKLTTAKEYEFAMEAYEESNNKQENPAVLNNLALLYAAHRKEKSLATALRAAELTQSQNPTILETLAQIALQNGDRPLAEKTAHQALQLNPPPALKEKLQRLLQPY